MIERFKMDDLRSFRPNRYSDPKEIGFAFDDDSYDKFSLIDSGRTEAIIIAKRYWGNNYLAFFLISDSFRIRNAVKLRDFVHSTHERFGVYRIQTDSEANDVLDAWHRFMGFTLEGRREKMMHGKDYHCWGLILGEK